MASLPRFVMNHLYYGDNLQILREHIKDESVDLIYLDPPFNSQGSYNVLFRSPTGKASEAQIEAFDDTWHWNDSAEEAFDDVMKGSNGSVAEMLRALRCSLKENDMMAYLTMMAVRLVELQRVLKPTGTLYLHCDPAASHYLKVLLDAIFGAENYRNEISWRRSSAHNDTKQGSKKYGNIRDVIFFYSKSKTWTWNPQYTSYSDSYTASMYRYIDAKSGRRYRKDNLTAAKAGGDTRYEWRIKRPTSGEWSADLDDESLTPKTDWEYKGILPYGKRIWAYSKANMRQHAIEGRIVYSKKSGMPNYKRYLDEMPGVALQNDWDDIMPASGNESLGYPTQKPLALMERIIRASSNEGDTVLDPFCGCGTTIHGSQKLNRQWAGIDITHLAISLIEKRLHEAFPGSQFEIEGTPKDISGARALFAADAYQFQWWAGSLVDAVPFGGKKKGADGGIDGLIYFKPDGKVTEKAIVSVKGGENVGVPMIRDLVGVVQREKAKIGIFITLAEPTKPMIVEAVKSGYYETPFGKFPKLQILTIRELFDGSQPKLPWIDPNAFKRIAREALDVQTQLGL
jgi:adenine specific DNA methylase Mod